MALQDHQAGSDYERSYMVQDTNGSTTTVLQKDAGGLWVPHRRIAYNALGVPTVTGGAGQDQVLGNAGTNFLYNGGYMRLSDFGRDGLIHNPGGVYDPYTGSAPVDDPTQPSSIQLPPWGDGFMGKLAIGWNQTIDTLTFGGIDGLSEKIALQTRLLGMEFDLNVAQGKVVTAVGREVLMTALTMGAGHALNAARGFSSVVRGSRFISGAGSGLAQRAGMLATRVLGQTGATALIQSARVGLIAYEGYRIYDGIRTGFGALNQGRYGAAVMNFSLAGLGALGFGSSVSQTLRGFTNPGKGFSIGTRSGAATPTDSALRANLKRMNTSDLSTAQKGALGEARTALTMRRAGFEELPARLSGNKGFDGVWVKRGSDGSIFDIVITESKFSSSGTLRLTNTASMGRQLSTQWINANIQNMLVSTNPNVVRAGMILRDNRNLIRAKAAVIDSQGIQRFTSV